MLNLILWELNFFVKDKSVGTITRSLVIKICFKKLRMWELSQNFKIT
ncbi:hypothetical protein LEP1GSC041_1499 [Leptospira noguchii str. 2006001870]|nr:hypothetical protein LEP1GSC041_1499 [Leptospira noguchii str. 2006001870]EMO28113.1 hypothetical protein LEP1GSC170_3442 [Leptospira interrogans serovar Bataviae str. HAI135]